MFIHCNAWKLYLVWCKGLTRLLLVLFDLARSVLTLLKSLTNSYCSSDKWISVYVVFQFSLDCIQSCLTFPDNGNKMFLLYRTCNHTISFPSVFIVRMDDCASRYVCEEKKTISVDLEDSLLLWSRRGRLQVHARKGSTSN